ncbi:Hsp20/alpha crystallin family protein [Bacillaceae bacterium Marseille-Q3522]|nr:Hsp20/alpha crystallin family protein [Bacillaceae bacterium Marseille-Q3522]
MSKEQKKQHPLEPFGGIYHSMNHIFREQPVKGFLQSIDDFFKKPFPFSSFSVNVREVENEFLITAELPGVKKEQIHIDIFDYSIAITVDHQETILEENENREVMKKSHTMQRLSRTISLPFVINEKTVKAAYENGLLTIKVPKQKRKSIEII